MEGGNSLAPNASPRSDRKGANRVEPVVGELRVSPQPALGYEFFVLVKALSVVVVYVLGGFDYGLFVLLQQVSQDVPLFAFSYMHNGGKTYPDGDGMA